MQLPRLVLSVQFARMPQSRHHQQARRFAQDKCTYPEVCSASIKSIVIMVELVICKRYIP